MRLAQAIEELQAALYAEMGAMDDEAKADVMVKIEENYPILSVDSECSAQDIKQYIQRYKEEFKRG